jgi:hypothetical protein
MTRTTVPCIGALITPSAPGAWPLSLWSLADHQQQLFKQKGYLPVKSPKPGRIVDITTRRTFRS